MKLFKKAKTWLASALCATLVLSGVGAVSALGVKAAEGDEPAQTVTVSQDIQTMLDSFNRALAIANGKATYVQNYKMANGGTASGIKIDIDCTTKTDNWGSGHERLDLVFNVKNFTGNSSPVASVILSPDEYPEIAGTATTESKGQAANNTNLIDFNIGLHNVDSYKGFTYYITGNEDSGGNARAVLDTRAKPEANLQHRIFPTDSASTYIVVGAYWPNNETYTYSTRARVGGLSTHGFSATPYSFWYDYETNVTYRDESSSSIHGSAYSRLGQFLSVNPTERTKVANFDNKYLGNNKTLIDAKTDAAQGASNTDKKYQAMTGFKDGKAQFSLRYSIKAGAKASMLFTNVMGLDLTNPANVYTDNVLVGVNKSVPATNSYAIPAPEYQTTLGNKTNKEFTGKVNVYSGARSFPYSYSAYGATKASISDDLGTPVQSNLNVGDTIDISTLGNYTLEYIADDGEVAYTTITSYEKIGIESIDLVNVTATLNGNPLTLTDTLAVGDVIKFIPNENYELYNFTSNDNNNERIILNGKTVALNENNEYIVKDSDVTGEKFNIISAAHNGKYQVNLGRLGGGNPASTYVYGGVDAKYYQYYNTTTSKYWTTKTLGTETVYTYYGLMYWDGKYAVMFSLPTASGYSVPADEKWIGYSLTKLDDGTALGVAKIGTATANRIPIYCNTAINPIITKSFIKTGTVKTKGTAGLQVKVYLDKASYDLLTNNYVKYASGNEYGYTANNAQTIKAVVVKGEKYTELSEIVKTSRNLSDSYGWSTFANNNAFKGNMAVTTITKFANDEVISGVTYKVMSLVIPGVSAEDITKTYYVGAFMDIGSCNGGDFLRIGQNGNTSMIEHKFLTASYNSFSDINIVADATEAQTYKYNFVYGNYIFASDVYQSYEIDDIVRAYVISNYNAYVSTVEVNGYTKHSTLDVWYDATILENDENAKVLVDLYDLI